MQARKLFTMVQCLEAINSFTRGKQVSVFEDMIKFGGDYKGDDELIIVGLDRDGYNGVDTCENVLRDGYKVYAASDSQGMREWLLEQLTGSSNFNNNQPLTVSGSKIDSLIAGVKGRIALFGAPSDELQRARFLPFVERCYSVKNNANTTGWAFRDNGLYYYEKTDDEIRTYIDQRLHINKNSGLFTKTHAELGDVELGFYWSPGNSADGAGSGFSGFGGGGTGGSDFYPVGADLSRTRGYANDAIIDCGWIRKNHDWLLANITSPDALPPPVPQQDTPGGGGDANAGSCESSGGALSWVICPVIEILDSATSWLDGQIQALLVTPDPTKASNGSSNPLQNAWARLRNIALVILVPIMLVMVISTALGFSFVDAYTLRKAMPRFLIAILFISLSWYITAFLVTISNEVGRGVLGIMTQPFGGANTSLPELITMGKGAAVSGAVGAGIFAAIVVQGPAIIGIILSFAFVAVIALLIGFLVLILRQMLILVLLLFAPLAILAWIFPGNDKLWKLWWGTFSKLLLMFPLIMALIAAGKIFALIIGQADGLYSGLNDWVRTLLVIVAYIIPYFFIPATFKAAGGVFGTLAGAVNDRSRGLFDRQKKFRQETAAKGFRDFKTGAVQGGFRGSLSQNVGTRIGVGMKGRFGVGSQEKYRQARDQLQRQASMENIMKDPAWGGVMNNDDALLAMTYDNAGQAQAELTTQWGDAERARRAVKAAQVSLGFGRPQAIAAAQQLVSTGTGYNDMEDMVAVLARASGGNRNTASALAGFANSETKKVGRHDLASSYGTLNSLVQGTAQTAPANFGIPTAAQWHDAHQAAWDSASMYEHVNDKPQNMQAHITHFETELASGDAARQERAAVFFRELRSSLPNAKGVVADHMRGALDRNNAAVDAVIAALPSTPLAPHTARDVVDPTAPLVQDPVTGEFRRQVVAQRAETAAERIDRQARAYERPDPNRF
jgi:hypothetical protein